MNQRIRRMLMSLSLPISVVVLLSALYVKRPGVRDYVDCQCPWVKQTIGKYAPPFEVRILPVKPMVPPSPKEIVTAQSAPPLPLPPPVPAPPPSSAVAPALAVDAFDFDKVCLDPARWPKTVRLKAIVEFPAVLNGKVFGKLRAPAGTEARVVKVINGKVGVEYRGGGAWLDFDRTDFIEQARLAWR